MKKHVFAIVLVMVVALIATFATTITSASATTTYDGIMTYDINDDGIVDRADFELIKNDILYNVGGNRHSTYSTSDLVVLELSFRNQVTYVSELKLSAENDWFIRNNLCTDQIPQLVENSSSNVVIECQFTKLVFNGLMDIYPLVAEEDIICTFYCANDDRPLCVCRYRGTYCLTTVKVLAPAIARLDANSLAVSELRDIFDNYVLKDIDISNRTLYFENGSGIYLEFKEADNYDYNNYNVISRASLENEPNFIITIISDGSSYRMTAVR